MKKIFTLIAAALMAVGVNAQTWNFSEWEAGDYASTSTKDGLTVVATEGKKITIDGNKKTFDDVQYTQRLKFGGTAAGPDTEAPSRYLSFALPAGANVTIHFAHASSSGDARTLNFAAGDFQNVVATQVVEAGQTASLKYTYSGDATTAYVYSANSGLNLYAIIVGGETAPVEEGGKKLVNMTGYSWLTSSYVQKEDGSWGNVYTRLEEPNIYDYNRYYYNAAGKQAVERTSSQHYRYNYNADGTVASRERWGNQGGVFCVTGIDAYEYDAAKNLVKTTTTSYNALGEATYVSGSKYSGYEKGEYTVMTNFSVTDGVEQDGYESHYTVSFNEAGQLVDKIQMLKNNETGEFDTPNTFEHNVYENGLLTTTTTGYYNAAAEPGHEFDSADATTTYTYNSDGTIKTRTEIQKTARYESEVEWRYTYAEQDAAYVPQNLTCDGTIIGNNEVYVKWDAVSGAEKYVVIYDNSEAEVEGKTEFVTPLLNDGEHQVAVLAIVGGEQKNITDFVKVSVKDEGNLPMENFKVLAAEKVDVESYGYVSSYYNLTLSWDVPAGASTITDYTVYVDKQNGDTWYPSAKYTSAMPQDEMKENYNDVNSWVTNRQNFYWTTFEDTYYDEDTWQTVSLGTGPTCKLWITATYATGESQKSNVVEVNIFNLANGGTDDVKAVNTVKEQAPVELFNVAGRLVGKANGRHQLILVRQGNEVRKVLK